MIQIKTVSIIDVYYSINTVFLTQQRIYEDIALNIGIFQINFLPKYRRDLTRTYQRVVNVFFVVNTWAINTTWEFTSKLTKRHIMPVNRVHMCQEVGTLWENTFPIDILRIITVENVKNCSMIRIESIQSINYYFIKIFSYFMNTTVLELLEILSSKYFDLSLYIILQYVFNFKFDYIAYCNSLDPISDHRKRLRYYWNSSEWLNNLYIIYNKNISIHLFINN